MHDNEHEHAHGGEHQHNAEHSTAHSSDNHEHTHEHRHHHTEQETKPILDRMSRAIGHLESVRRMIADGRDCGEILVQLSAVKSALNRTGLLILQNHIEHCIVEAVASGDMDAVAELNSAIAVYLK